MTPFPYDTTYQPAAPVCTVTIRSVSSGQQTEVRAFIDTGADATIVPVDELRRAGARRSFETALRSQWGERRTVFLYLVDLIVADVVIPGVYAVGDELGQETILGRDVLNKLLVTLDGPRLQAMLTG